MLIQDTYLENLRTSQIAVSLYLINGIKLLGQISAYDTEVVLLRDNKNLCEQLIYKHAISTIVPNRSQMQGSDFE
ncbi:MAG: chaperone Hfq [Burkholderiales bacterium]|jgi:host factor-I protein|nr:chaperone Hfq [Burkholderiales bacterium]